MEWSPYVLPGLFAGLAAWVLAAVVLKTAPHRPQNRILFGMLVLEGAIALLLALTALTDDWSLLTPIFSTTMLAAGMLALFYLAFLGTLRAATSLSLRPAVVRRTLIAAALSLPFAWSFLWSGNGDATVTIYLLGVVLLFGLLVTGEAFFRSPKGSSERTRAGGLFLAFGWRDLTMGGTLLWLLWMRSNDLGPTRYLTHGDQIVWPAITLVFVLLLSYGILRTQLFDIDLRIKKGLRRSLVAAPFVVAFFVGGELLEEVVPVGDSLFLGILLAGVVTLGIQPIQRAALRLSDRLMPGTPDSDDYVQIRKAEVFRAALEGAAADGQITAREESILMRLQAELGLDETVATQLRSQVLTVTDGSA